MSNPSTCMLLDKSSSSFDYQEALDERLMKAHAVMISLMCNDNWEHINSVAVTNSLWTVETLIEKA